MPNPDALWQDIQKLDDMYEELMWHPDDELQFTHDGEKIIITNKRGFTFLSYLYSNNIFIYTICQNDL